MNLNRRGFFGILVAPYVARVLSALESLIPRRGHGPTIEQITAITYPAILFETQKTSRQWKEAFLLRELHRQGMIVPISGKPIQMVLDTMAIPNLGSVVSESLSQLSSGPAIDAGTRSPELPIGTVSTRSSETRDRVECGKDIADISGIDRSTETFWRNRAPTDNGL